MSTTATTIPEALDDADHRWLELGRKLRRNNPALYQELCALVVSGRNPDHEARFRRVVKAAGGDPASLLLMIATMERIVTESSTRKAAVRS